jgi:hypothetical protein
MAYSKHAFKKLLLLPSELHKIGLYEEDGKRIL